jgi:hypothetical protein
VRALARRGLAVVAGRVVRPTGCRDDTLPPAATVNITDCAAAPVKLVGKKTVINASADDLVIRCALLPLNGQSRIEVTARSIFVDGDNGGSIAAPVRLWPTRRCRRQF